MFESTMAGLKSGLKVRDVATFDIVSCSVTERVDKVLADEDHRGIDQFPVRRDGRIVGILERIDDPPGELVSEAMRPLDDSLLISGDAPLSQLLPLMRERSYRLVLTESTIDGIVTRSDLLKLPVRVLAFTLVTHTELLMAELIRQRHPTDDDWLNAFSPGRAKMLREEHSELEMTRIDLPLLEVAQFCDKRDIVRKLYKLPGSFTKDLKKVEDLRNVVAHAGTYANDNQALLKFVGQMELTREWIGRLSDLAEKSYQRDIQPQEPK